MTHTFEVADAEKWGLESAILIQMFRFWLAKNIANGRHNHDGRTWTYNSVAAFGKLFPYLTPSQIRRTLGELVEQGVLRTGNYNASTYDRTLWYAFEDEAAMLQNQQIHLSDLANGSAETNKSVNSSSTSSKTISSKKGTGELFAFASDMLPPPLDTQECRDAWDLWQEECRRRKAPLTELAARRQIAKLQAMGPEKAVKSINQSIENRWRGLFEPKDDKREHGRPHRAGADYKALTAENAI